MLVFHHDAEDSRALHPRAGGGAERQTINYLRFLDRQRFEPLLYLHQCEGELLPSVPEDVPVITFWDRHQQPRFNYPGRIRRWQIRDLSRVLAERQIDVVCSVCRPCMKAFRWLYSKRWLAELPCWRPIVPVDQQKCWSVVNTAIRYRQAIPRRSLRPSWMPCGINRVGVGVPRPDGVMSNRITRRGS